MIHNSFFQAICRVGIFMICAQAIVHFRPNESYEKYLKLLMSIMVLMQLFVPIGSFFFGGGGMKAAELMEQFEKELADGMSEVEKSAQEADRLLEQMTLEEVRRRVEEAADAAIQGEEATGAAGTAGTTGASGTAGKAGAAGASGAAGKTGSAGASGTTGKTGAAGASGAAGKTGSAGASGNTGTSGTTEKTGADRADEREAIRIELEGIEPIKIGQEE